MLANKAAYKGVSEAYLSLSSGANYQSINHQTDLDQPQLKRTASVEVEQRNLIVPVYFLFYDVLYHLVAINISTVIINHLNQFYDFVPFISCDIRSNLP